MTQPEGTFPQTDQAVRWLFAALQVGVAAPSLIALQLVAAVIDGLLPDVRGRAPDPLPEPDRHRG